MAAIDGKRQAGLVENARQLFEASRGVMTDDQIKAVEHRLKPVVDHTYGAGLGEEVFNLRQSGKMTAVEAQKYLNEKTRGRPEANTAAEMTMRELEQRKREDFEQKAGYRIELFLRARRYRRVVQQLGNVQRVPALDKPAQGKLREHLLTQIRVADRADKAAESEQWNTPEVWAKFDSLLNDPALGRRDANSMSALSLEVGPQKMAKLEARKKELLAGAAKFSIDADLLKEAIPKKLFSPDNKVKLAAFKALSNRIWRTGRPATPALPHPLRNRRRLPAARLLSMKRLGYYGAPTRSQSTRRRSMNASSGVWTHNERIGKPTCETKRRPAYRSDYRKTPGHVGQENRKR